MNSICYMPRACFAANVQDNIILHRTFFMHRISLEGAQNRTGSPTAAIFSTRAVYILGACGMIRAWRNVMSQDFKWTLVVLGACAAAVALAMYFNGTL